MDYVGPDIETEDIKNSIRKRRKTFFYGWLRMLYAMVCQQRSHNNQIGQTDEEKNCHASIPRNMTQLTGRDLESKNGSDLTSAQEVLPHDDATTVVPTEFDVQSPAFTTSKLPKTLHDAQSSQGLSLPINTQAEPITTAPRHRLTTFFMHVRTFLKLLFTPPSIAIILGFVISVVQPLKALFVVVPSVHMPAAPDGLPPLTFLLDTTTFIGGASVPLGLISLGAALARLIVPRNKEAWRALPLGAIAGVAVGRIIVMPVLGVLIVQGLVRGGMIPKQDKVLQFVCM